MVRLWDKPSKIRENTHLDFQIDKPGWYLIEVSARVKGEKQRNNTDDEDLHLEIDNQKFPQLANPNRYLDSPAAFSGGKLHGLQKTVYFLYWLDLGKHTLTLIPDNSAEILKINYGKLNLSNAQLRLNLNKQAEDGDRRPWLTFVLTNLPLTSFTVTATTQKRYHDSDDLKIIIDGETQSHFDLKDHQKPTGFLGKTLSWFYRFWYFAGSVLQGEWQTSHFKTNLLKGLHYIELHTDRTPTVESVEFDFGELPRIPSVDDPRWTGDFSDDSNQIILARALFGEARNTLVPDKARIAIGWVIRNRVESPKWPNNYHGVVTKPLQISAFNTNDDNRPFVENPLHTGKAINKEAWEHAYEIAGKIINDQISDPTQGANHYYDDSINVPPWAKNETPVLTITYTNQFGVEANIFFLRL